MPFGPGCAGAPGSTLLLRAPASGVAGGLVTAVVSASLLLHSVLVWLLGDPGAVGAREHFGSAPAAAAGTVVGLLVWWYHQQVLRGAGMVARTEVRRIYEYLMAGIGLVAAAVGLTMVLSGLIETLTGRAFGGGHAVNTLLAAADPEIARAVAHRTHRRVQAWSRTDDGAGTWPVEDVMAALSVAGAQEVLVLAEPHGLRTIPLRRAAARVRP